MNHVTSGFFSPMGLAILAMSLPGAAQPTDTLWHDLFGGTGPKDNSVFSQHFLAHSDNWSVRNTNTDSAVIATSGTISTNTYLMYKHLMTDLEFEVTERLQAAGKNSGVQFRSTCYTTSDAPPCGAGYRVCGPQADLGNTHDGELFAECGNALVNVATPNGPTTAPNFINNTTTACRQQRKNYPSWTTIRTRVVGNKVVGYLNDTKCYEYTISNSAWMGAGIFGLQYHTGGAYVEFKSVRLKNLSVTTGLPSSGEKRTVGHKVEGGQMSLSFSIPDAGHYDVEVSDLRGQAVRFDQGQGPVHSKRLSLESPGIYLVRIISKAGTSLQKAYAY